MLALGRAAREWRAPTRRGGVRRRRRRRRRKRRQASLLLVLQLQLLSPPLQLRKQPSHSRPRLPGLPLPPWAPPLVPPGLRRAWWEVGVVVGAVGVAAVVEAAGREAVALEMRSFLCPCPLPRGGCQGPWALE